VEKREPGAYERHLLASEVPDRGKAAAKMRSLSVWIAIIFFTLALHGCGDNPMRPGPPPDVPADVRSFVTTEGLPELQGIKIVFAGDGEVLLFQASYGTVHDCPSGCFYSSALGLRLDEKIGWIHFDDFEDIDPTGFHHFDVKATDAALFDTSFWSELENADSRTLWAAFLPMLAADTDTPPAALMEIARLLRNYISGTVVWSLLDNPNVRKDREILEVLAGLPEFSGDPYESARQKARELLDELSEPRTPECTWVAIDPIQCLGNPWEQDWLEKHDDDYESYPRDWESRKRIIWNYYRELGVRILDITAYRTMDAVCEACSCPEGYTLYLYVVDRHVRTMLALGFRLEEPVRNDPYGPGPLP
jgi:hypothetical protein